MKKRGEKKGEGKSLRNTSHHKGQNYEKNYPVWKGWEEKEIFDKNSFMA